MSDTVYVVLLFGSLCVSFAVGLAVHLRLPDGYRTKDTLDFIKTVAGMLVSLTALVLGLLLVEVNSDFRKTSADFRVFGSTISLLGDELTSLGPPAQQLQAQLRAYTAAVIASTYPAEPPPAGVYPQPEAIGADIESHILGDLLREIQKGIRNIVPHDSETESAKAAALSRMTTLLDERGVLIGDAHDTFTPLIVTAMALWMLIVFFSFGLSFEQNWATTTAVVIVALGVSSAVFIILDLAGPLDGHIKVSSAPLHRALHHLDRSITLSRG